MSELISYHLEDGIATLTLSNGKVNAISPDVIAAFNAALDQAEADRAIALCRALAIAPFQRALISLSGCDGSRPSLENAPSF